MPIEPAKEAAKLVVESTGILSSIWEWIIAGIGTALSGLWLHITRRLSRIEQNQVTSTRLDSHIIDEERKFSTLFDKHDSLLDKVSSIAASVARIEGKLGK